MWPIPVVTCTAVFSAVCVATIAANSTTPFYYEYVDESNVDPNDPNFKNDYSGQGGETTTSDGSGATRLSLWTIVGISCGAVAVLLIIAAMIGVAVCMIRRKRRRNGEKAKPLLPSKDSSTTEQVFSADDFLHKGPLEIKREEEIKLDTKSLALPESPKAPPADPEAHFRFEEKANLVYDIGSDVERIV